MQMHTYIWTGTHICVHTNTIQTDRWIHTHTHGLKHTCTQRAHTQTDRQVHARTYTVPTADGQRTQVRTVNSSISNADSNSELTTYNTTT